MQAEPAEVQQTVPLMMYSTSTGLNLPLLRRAIVVRSTEQFGRAMLPVVRHGAPKRVLESADINALVP
jgi:hypothetical protein